MLAQHFGKIIKDQRLRKGLRQEDLAAKAHVARAVISQLERGKRHAVQSDTIERLLQALDVDWQAAAAREDPRKLARLEQEKKLNEQRVRHLRLAVDLAADDVRAAREKIAKARERVKLWRKNKSCGPFYIERWSQVLALSPKKVAKEMSAFGEWEDALFQNSPWSWAWT